MIEKVIQAMTGKDYMALASCFSEDCKLFDYCPAQNGGSNNYIYGSDCMEMLFRSLFVSGGFTMAEPLIEDDNHATFFISYGGPYVYARIDIEEYDRSGSIKKAIIHPA